MKYTSQFLQAQDKRSENKGKDHGNFSSGQASCVKTFLRQKHHVLSQTFKYKKHQLFSDIALFLLLQWRQSKAVVSVFYPLKALQGSLNNFQQMMRAEHHFHEKSFSLITHGNGVDKDDEMDMTF